VKIITQNENKKCGRLKKGGVTKKKKKRTGRDQPTT